MKYLLFLLVLIPVISFAQIPSSASDVNPIPKGQPFPAGLLYDADNSPVEVSNLLTSKPTVFIFYRGGWCPYCSRHLADLAKIENDIEQAGYQLLAVSPDLPEYLPETAEKNDVVYRLLSDKKLVLAKALGLAFKVDEQYKKRLKKGLGISLAERTGEPEELLPVPAVYVVNKNAQITYVYYNADYKTRLSGEKLLEAIRANQH